MAHRARTAILLESLKPETAGKPEVAGKPENAHEAHQPEHGVLGHAAESIGAVIGSIAAKVKTI